MKRFCSALGSLIVTLTFAGALQSRTVPQACGTYRDQGTTVLKRHEQRQRLRRDRGTQTLAVREAAATNRTAGDIVIIDDSGGVISNPAKRFDLAGKSLTFLPQGPAAARYRYLTGPESYDSQAALSGQRLDLGDDDSRPINLPFDFPFFGNTYRLVFVNSDGNLTFRLPDVSYLPRDLGRVLGGPPRIAPLFLDLDPGRAASSEGVRVLVSPERVTISWVKTPEYADYGSGVIRTFQVRLFPDGRIEFTWLNTSVFDPETVVGIAPGGNAGSLSVVSFTTDPSDEYGGPVAEVFAVTQEVDILLAAQKFYQTNEDAYDFLVFFNNQGVPATSGAVAYEVTVRSMRDGIGDTPKDMGARFGSPSRLQAVLNMGHLGEYSENPLGIVYKRPNTGDTPLSILAHEVGHLYLALASVRDPGNPAARPMLNTSLAHWSYVFNAEASFLEGNRIIDSGPGALPRFRITETVNQYSPLDQYLMGLRAPEEVPGTFLVTGADGLANHLPQPGASIFGTGRRDITVAEVMAAEGRRAPDHTLEQREYRAAFVLIVRAGSEPSAGDLAKLEAFRSQFEDYFHRASGFRATLSTALRKQLRLSVAPYAGVLLNRTLEAFVEVGAPVAQPLSVQLSVSGSAIAAPPSVEIPAGAKKVSFPLQGKTRGVSRLTASATAPGYETTTARVEVISPQQGDELRIRHMALDPLVVLPGLPLPEAVTVRAVSANNVPYAGLRLRAQVTGDGMVEPAEADTDERGMASFYWTPSSNPLNEMTLQFADIAAPAAIITALGQPWFNADSVVNAASFAPGLTPGSWASIFGANLAAGGSGSVSTPPYPQILGGVQVLVGGQAARLSYVSERQVNFLVPDNLPAGSAEVVVVNAMGVSTPIPVTVRPIQPGIFFDAATGWAAVLKAGTSNQTQQDPPAGGEFIEIYCTGLGPVRLSPRGLWETADLPQVMVGNLPAEVIYSGLHPVYPGLYQVNVGIPVGAPTGRQRLTLTLGGINSNTADILLR